MSPDYKSSQGLVITLALLRLIDKNVKIRSGRLVGASMKILTFDDLLHDYYRKKHENRS